MHAARIFPCDCHMAEPAAAGCHVVEAASGGCVTIPRHIVPVLYHSSQRAYKRVEMQAGTVVVVDFSIGEQ